MFSLSLFAESGRPAGSLLDRPEFIYATLGLAGSLLAGAVVVFLVDRWRKRDQMRERETAHELTDFRRLYEGGEITEEEYNRLRLKVAGRVKTPVTEETTAPAFNDSEAPPPPAGPIIPGPLPADYFDDPKLKDPPQGGSTHSGGVPPA